MKIVMVTDFFGEMLEYQENLLLKYYVKHNHSVTVVASTEDSVQEYVRNNGRSSKPARTYEFRGATIVRLPHRCARLPSVRSLKSLAQVLTAERPDLIFFHDISMNLLDGISYLETHPSTRMVLDFHGDRSNSGRTWLSRRLHHGLVRRWYLSRARSSLSRIFPVTPASAEFLNRIYAVPQEEMELLPLGADGDAGKVARDGFAGKALRQRYGIRASDVVLVTGGKLTPLKKTEALIDAVRMLDRPELHLIIMGATDPTEPDYEKLLCALGAKTPRVRFTGWLSAQEVYNHFDMADIAAFPSSQSILWQQAISMGLPLVVGLGSQDQGRLQDVSYLNGENNILILDATEPIVSELIRCVGMLMDDVALRKRMALGARRVAEQCLNWDQMIAKTTRFNEPFNAES